MTRIIAWFTKNAVAANLIMIMIIAAGAVGMMRIRREVFPNVSLDTIIIRVPYRGATPVDVEEGIVIRIEEAISGLAGIDSLDSVSAEGIGTVTVKVDTRHDTRKMIGDVKTRIDGISSFPLDAEEPIVEELELQARVLTVAVSVTDGSERLIREVADEVRDDLLAVEGITQVSLGGVRPYEIGIHISEDGLRRYGLTFDEVARAVRSSSLDLPAGSIRAVGGDILLRTRNQAYVGREFGELVLVTRADGTRLHLRDVADVVDGFDENHQWARFNGNPAAILTVKATANEDVTEVASAVHRYVAEAEGRFPDAVGLDVWFDFSRYYSDRQALMLKNGMTGLALVLLCLALFLQLRLAFWVAIGLAIAFIGTFAVLPMVDVSINMISMAAFILVLGIVVDDAIVVAESIHHCHSTGLLGAAGSLEGTRRVAAPVIFAVLTSVIAFCPMLTISGVDGKFWRMIPIPIISCLLFSLVESLLILPSHLAHRRLPFFLIVLEPFLWALEKAIHPVHRVMDHGLRLVITRVYYPFLKLTLTWRYLTAAAFFGLLTVAIGMFLGGHIPQSFFPVMIGDNATASLEMPEGTASEVTVRILQRLEEAAERVREQVDGDPNQPPLFKHVLVTLGSRPFTDSRDHFGSNASGAPNLAEVVIELQNQPERGISAEDVADMWREEVGELAGPRQLNFSGETGNARKDIHYRLATNDIDDLKLAADDLKQSLAGFDGVFEISDSFGSRRNEITLDMKPHGEALGLRVDQLGRQVRQAFHGEEAQRILRGRDEIRVMVRYPLEQRRSVADLTNLRIRTIGGDEVPLGEVAEARFGKGLARINRSSRRRVVDITAMIDRTVVDNSTQTLTDIEGKILPALIAKYPGMSWSAEGGMKDKAKLLGELKTGFFLALFTMYALMAIAFRSYVQPLLVAVAIPFGLIGAVAGHLLLGHALSIISFLGLVALAGVVVNDSLVLIDAINRRIREQGMSVKEALHHAAPSRFRAILLTSITTFAGLTPLMAETSVQARFLIPMAIALAFGVAFATVVTLVLLPTLYLIIEDLSRISEWIQRKLGMDVDPDSEEPPEEKDEFEDAIAALVGDES